MQSSKRSKSTTNISNLKKIRTDNSFVQVTHEHEEYLEIQNPKHEPLEYISDSEDQNIKEETISQLLDQQQVFSPSTSSSENAAQDQGKFLFKM